MESRARAESFHRPLSPQGCQRLAACRFVLVEPTHPGNVGAAARAMAAMGLRDLIVTGVGAAGLLSDPEARARATAAGQPLLEGARAVPGLDEAVADCQLVIAVSAESRAFGPEPAMPGAVAEAALAALADGEAQRVAFVFGPERTGLSIEALGRCQRLVTIPADPRATSLNLAQAVQVIAFVLRQTALTADGAGTEVSPKPAAVRLADRAAVEALLRRIERTLIAIEALDPDAPRQMMPRLRRLFRQIAIDRADVDLVHGVLNQIDALASRRDSSDDVHRISGERPGRGRDQRR